MEELQTYATKGRGESCAWRSQRPSPEVSEVLQQEQLGGEELCSICKEIGLTLFIREPTRGEHLLDLVLSSVPVMKTEVLPMTDSDGHVAALGAISCRGWTQGVEVRKSRLGTTPRHA